MRSAALLACFFCWNSSFADVAARDDFGAEVRLAQPAQRIVSLSPHLTENLYAAGAGAKLVGAVDFSDYPAEARRLPRVGSNAAIDLEALLALKPDLVVAWPSAETRRAIDRVAELGVPLFRSEPRELEDIATTLERLGTLAGTPGPAAAAAGAFRARVRALERRYAGRPPVRIFYQIWDQPILTVNDRHVISKAIALCGGENVFAGLPLLVPQVDREAVLAANPDAIVASGSGGAPPDWLESWKAFPQMRAVARRQLYVIPPDLLQRHTPRLLDGAERLCPMIDEVRRSARS